MLSAKQRELQFSTFEYDVGDLGETLPSLVESLTAALPRNDRAISTFFIGFATVRTY
jgi:hypothetical protein